MPLELRIRLSVMMFLQYFVWGAWYVSAGPYLGETVGFTGSQIGWTYAVLPIAAIVSPFFVGMVADRFFATQKVLGALHLAGGALLWAATLITTSLGESPSEETLASAALWFNLVLFLHGLCYMPTLALTNSLSFHHIDDPGRQFPGLRVLGTIGWIVVSGIIVSLIFGLDKKVEPFWIGAGTAILLGLYCFTLPHTPPPSAGKDVTVREVLGLDALELMRNPPFAVFIVSSFLIVIPLAAYYAFAGLYIEQVGIENPLFKMSFGQMSEILFLLVMPFFFVRLGVKYMLLVGMLAWVARYALFSIGAPDAVFWMLMTGVILHGICYDFFFVTGQIYVDKKAPREIRGSAQGFLVLMTLGLGLFIGSKVAGWVFDAYAPANVGPETVTTPVTFDIKKEKADDGTVVETRVWNVDKDNFVGWKEAAAREVPFGRVTEFAGSDVDPDVTIAVYGKREEVEPPATAGSSAETAPDDGEEAKEPEHAWVPTGEIVVTRAQELTVRYLPDWRWIWLWPCAIAAAVMLAFALLFRDREVESKVEAEAEEERRPEAPPPDEEPLPGP